MIDGEEDSMEKQLDWQRQIILEDYNDIKVELKKDSNASKTEANVSITSYRKRRKMQSMFK
ncbi:hypothetical protein [Bacillus salitolerans]